MKRIVIFIILYAAISIPLIAIQHNFQPPQSTSDTKLNLFSHRHALVIGNNNYKMGRLLNPANDAQDMEIALQKLGFNVTQRIDLSKDEMKKEVRTFSKKLQDSGGVGLFYFAGHGVQVENKNYLIPVGAIIDNEDIVEYEAVEADWILGQMLAAKAHLNIMILDACRTNPFVQSTRSSKRGLAVMTAPKQRQTLIAYATSPNSVADDGEGRNGTYTSELLKNIQAPGIQIEDLFKRVRAAVRIRTNNKQIPWESSSLEDDFYFNPIDECSGSSITLGRGPRRLEMQLPKGWKKTRHAELDNMNVNQVKQEAEKYLGIGVPEDFIKDLKQSTSIAIEHCSGNEAVLVVTNFNLNSSAALSQKEFVQRLVSNDTKESLSIMFQYYKDKFAQAGFKLEVKSNPQKLSPGNIEGGKMTFKFLDGKEENQGIIIICRNILADKSVFIIVGLSESRLFPEMESIVQTLVRR